jgi:hypothetical protein
MKPATRRQRKAHAMNRARGLAHWNRAVQLSAEGFSKAEAAERLGLTADGMNSLLYRNRKSQVWPIKED